MLFDQIADLQFILGYAGRKHRQHRNQHRKRSHPQPPIVISLFGEGGQYSPQSCRVGVHSSRTCVILSNSRCSRTSTTPSPRKWERPCAALPSPPISKNAATTPAPSSIPQAKSSPWAITCRFIWVPCPCRLQI